MPTQKVLELCVPQRELGIGEWTEILEGELRYLAPLVKNRRLPKLEEVRVGPEHWPTFGQIATYLEFGGDLPGTTEGFWGLPYRSLSSETIGFWGITKRKGVWFILLKHHKLPGRTPLPEDFDLIEQKVVSLANILGKYDDPGMVLRTIVSNLEAVQANDLARAESTRRYVETFHSDLETLEASGHIFPK